jgi:hypothetical protein
MAFVKHGTLRVWAEKIIEYGPDPYFRLPGEGQGTSCEGLSCYRSDETECVFGTLESYARGKAILYPDELCDEACEFGEVRFSGPSIQKLMSVWPEVKKTARIIGLD